MNGHNGTSIVDVQEAPDEQKGTRPRPLKHQPSVLDMSVGAPKREGTYIQGEDEDVSNGFVVAIITIFSLFMIMCTVPLSFFFTVKMVQVFYIINLPHSEYISLSYPRIINLMVGS